ncbi:MAG: GNAT family N-acetyltransferase [Candidatus Woesearchaeota archaeon]
MIRRLKRSDIDLITNFAKRTKKFRKKEIKELKNSLEYAFKNEGEYYKAKCYVENGSVKGVVVYGETYLTTATYDIYWIIVDPYEQGRGIGSRLLKHAEKKIIERGAKIIILNTSSKKSYRAVRKFYEHRGYKIEARIKNYYRKRDDLLIYVKRIKN